MKKNVKLIILMVLIVAASTTIILTFYNKKSPKLGDELTIGQALRAVAYSRYGAQADTDYIEKLSTDKIIDNNVKVNKPLTYEYAAKLIKGLNIHSDSIDLILQKTGTIFEEDWNKIFEYIYLSSDNAKSFKNEDITVAAYDDKAIVCKEGNYLYTYTKQEKFFERYKDKKINVITFDNNILFVNKVVSDQIVYENVWIKSNKKKLNVYMYGITRSFSYSGKDDISDVIADISITDGSITKLSLKKDIINGKVLSIDDTFIEIEGFGKVPIAEGFKVYKDYAELELAGMKSILVGYDVQDFVVAQGKICAAIIHSNISAKNIRVLLKTTQYTDIYHQNAVITCDGDYEITYGKKKKVIKAGKVLNFKLDSDYFKEGRIQIKPVNEKNKISIMSIERSYGNPIYRGSIELEKTDNGILIVNELSMEKYLYAVVPSEMPVSYGDNALMVQAVCARTYAYRQIMNNSCSTYGAHVDDSISFQVYNNSMETKESIAAVKATYGKIMKYDGEAIEAFFFSTSCGATTQSDIWGGEKLPYLQSKYLSDEKAPDLTDESTFDKFIRKKVKTYDSGYDLYRWNVTLSREELSYSVNKALGTMNNVETKYIGTVTKIEPVSRGMGGVLKELKLTGTDGSVVVKLQSNIRQLFDISSHAINTLSGTTKNLSSLPSACFVVDKKKDESGNVVYTFVGGGFGHGVGMSQNATKTMSDNKMSWEEILKFFYTDIDIVAAY